MAESVFLGIVYTDPVAGSSDDDFALAVFAQAGDHMVYGWFGILTSAVKSSELIWPAGFYVEATVVGTHPDVVPAVFQHSEYRAPAQGSGIAVLMNKEVEIFSMMVTEIQSAIDGSHP